MFDRAGDVVITSRFWYEEIEGIDLGSQERSGRMYAHGKAYVASSKRNKAADSRYRVADVLKKVEEVHSAKMACSGARFPVYIVSKSMTAVI